ncbi:hypothetical protein [Calderihabitans maritimus]|uniref:2-phosphosulfolactate phosphatase n=1 Tax=Calderihabitans maritimus TaxID=1246530 RepID=A0A1Z5HQN1_9FIRM|nr:hypothetical protein [Calderihabitans maritimus]GAW91677.1 hypothetical protein KKC1_08380 [Calderihabitans maritimus]
MERANPPSLWVTANASGAVEAARTGRVVVVVDVIDMSTTLETVLDAGALAVFGASPDGAEAPVPVFPEKIGYAAATLARQHDTEVLVVGEPRLGTDTARLQNASRLIEGIEAAGGVVAGIIPNLGADTGRLADFNGRVVVAVTASGGVVYDAAFNAGGEVITATVARTLKKKGVEPALAGARRAIELARRSGKGIAVVAASSNSWEDVLAAQFIAGSILQEGFLQLEGSRNA